MFKEIKIAEKEMSSKLSRVKRWKEKIIAYTKSETRRKELEFENIIDKREENIQKTKEIERKKEEERKTKEERKKQKTILTDVKSALGYENIKVPGFRNLKNILDIDESVRNGLKKIDSFPRDTEVIKYKTIIIGLTSVINNELYFGKNIEQEDLEELKEIAEAAANGSFGREISELAQYDQNHLKQRVFDSFKYLVKEKEMNSLKQELEKIKEKEKKKGIARIFRGPSKAENKKMAEINGFFDTYEYSEEKGDRVYSARKIVAEIEMFIEDYKTNPDYSSEIKRANELKEILDDTFSYSRDDVEKIKNERRAHMDGKDAKVERILRLDKDERDAPQITSMPKCPCIEKLRHVEIKIKNRNKIRERNQNYDHEN